MGSSKTSVGHRSKKTTSHQAKKTSTIQSLMQQTLSAIEDRKHSWTKEQLSDADFLKVPASVWKNIHTPAHTEYIDVAEDTLASALTATALTHAPIFGLVKVHKWFWDNSVETKFRNDTYRFRVIDQATDTTILPEDESDDGTDDETKIKILYVGLPFKDHLILLLRRICPDASMSPIKTDDEWKQYLAPSIRQGYWQIRRSTTYGWPPTVNRKKSRNTGRTRRSKIPAAAAPQSPPSDISETARFFGYYDL